MQKAIIVISFLIVTLLCVIPLSSPVKESKEGKLKGFPVEIGSWRMVKELPIDDLTYKILETKAILSRVYANPSGETVYLSIVYSDSNTEAFHLPEVCLRGSGLQLIDQGIERILIDTGELRVKKLYGKREAESDELFLFWYTAKRRTTPNYYLQQLYLGWDKLIHRRFEGGLLKVSTSVKRGNEDKALERSKAFIKELLPHLRGYLWEDS